MYILSRRDPAMRQRKRRQNSKSLFPQPPRSPPQGCVGGHNAPPTILSLKYSAPANMDSSGALGRHVHLHTWLCFCATFAPCLGQYGPILGPAGPSCLVSWPKESMVPKNTDAIESNHKIDELALPFLEIYIFKLNFENYISFTFARVYIW